MSYEYKVIPAPVRGLKAKGVKTQEERFAHALEQAMNELADDGWEYIRADTLPCEQRDGLMSKTTVFQNMLVFRRAKSSAAATTAPKPATVSASARRDDVGGKAPPVKGPVAEAVLTDVKPVAEDDGPTQIADPQETAAESKKSAETAS